MYDQQIIFDWSQWALGQVLGLGARSGRLLASPGLDLDTDGPEVERCDLDTPPAPRARRSTVSPISAAGR